MANEEKFAEGKGCNENSENDGRVMEDTQRSENAERGESAPRRRLLIGSVRDLGHTIIVRDSDSLLKYTRSAAADAGGTQMNQLSLLLLFLLFLLLRHRRRRRRIGAELNQAAACEL